MSPFKELRLNVENTREEIEAITEDLKLSLLVLRANHDERVHTRRDDND